MGVIGKMRIAGGNSARSLGTATRRSGVHALIAFGLFVTPALAQTDPPAWTRATPAFRITENIWYVGSEGLAAYLIKTRDGAILIDGTLKANVAAIKHNIVTTNTRLRDVKVILVSHAHFDHAEAVAELAYVTGAKVLAGVRDREALATGVPPGETAYGVVKFPAVPFVRGLGDGGRVALGGVTLTAVATPGHTPGCTSYRMRSEGRDVLFLCSLTVAGNKLVANGRYSTIVQDYRRTFRKLAGLRADIVLPFHPESADLLGRRQRREGFVQPGLLADTVTKAAAAFDAELARQRAAPR